MLKLAIAFEVFFFSFLSLLFFCCLNVRLISQTVRDLLSNASSSVPPNVVIGRETEGRRKGRRQKERESVCMRKKERKERV